MPYRYDYEDHPNADYLGKQLLERYTIEEQAFMPVWWNRQTQLSQKQPPLKRTGSNPVIGTKHAALRGGSFYAIICK